MCNNQNINEFKDDDIFYICDINIVDIDSKMKRIINFNLYQFSNKNNRPQINSQKLGSLEGLIVIKKKQQLEGIQQYKRNLPLQQHNKFINDHLANIRLYMRHDCWRSQYIYALMNYNKIGFKRISDLYHLDSTSYHLDLRKIKDQQRWPLVRLEVGLQPQVIMRGIIQIQNFFNNNLFQKNINKNSSQVEVLSKFIDEHIVPHLQRIFWHPFLTFQYSFHTNRSSYDKGVKSYAIFGILYRNFGLIGQRIVKNIINILKHKQDYLKSKERLIKGLKDIQIILQNNNFFGGKQPNYVDFYLLSIIKTKESSYFFMKFLQDQVGGNIWKWLVRISMQTQADSQRMTFL